MRSPNYPKPYDPHEPCQITAPLRPLYTIFFHTLDRLSVGGQQYSGTTGPPPGMVSSQITWIPGGGSGSGWEICIQSAQTLGLNSTDYEIETRCADKDLPKQRIHLTSQQKLTLARLISQMMIWLTHVDSSPSRHCSLQPAQDN